MKSIKELVSEAANENVIVPLLIDHEMSEAEVFQMHVASTASFKKGATFATNLVFSRVVEALRNEKVHGCNILEPIADFLVRNKQRIIGMGGDM